MARRKKLVPTQLFLRVGMDEPAFVRAVFIIDSFLPARRRLDIDDSVRKVFAEYWSVGGRDAPALPEPDKELSDTPREPLTMLRAGMQFGKSDSYSSIEIRYARKYFPVLVKAINDFVPDADDEPTTAEAKLPARGGRPTTTEPAAKAEPSTPQRGTKAPVEAKTKVDAKTKQQAPTRSATPTNVGQKTGANQKQKAGQTPKGGKPPKQ